MFSDPKTKKTGKEGQRLNVKLALIYILLVLLFVSLIFIL